MNSLLAAAWEGHIEQIVDLIHSGASLKQATPTGDTALHLAITNQHLVAAKLLISYGADLNSRNKFGCTAFHVAILVGDQGLIEYMLQQGADVNKKYLCGKDNKYYSPLFITFRLDMLETMRLLIEYGANVSSVYCKRSLWEMAIYYSKVEVIKLLVNGMEFSKSCRNAGISAFFSVVKKNHFHTIYNLKHNTFPINIKDSTGMTGLHVAVKMGHYESIRHLLFYGMDMHARDNKRRTPLSISMKNTFLTSYMLECMDEIELMKKDIAFENITYYDILFMSSIKLAAYVKSDNVREIGITKRHEEKYVKYGVDVTHKILLGIKRRMKIHMIEDNLYDFSRHFQTPVEISENILSYLDKKDLNNLRTAFEHNTLTLFTKTKNSDHADRHLNGNEPSYFKKVWNIMKSTSR